MNILPKWRPINLLSFSLSGTSNGQRNSSSFKHPMFRGIHPFVSFSIKLLMFEKGRPFHLYPNIRLSRKSRTATFLSQRGPRTCHFFRMIFGPKTMVARWRLVSHLKYSPLANAAHTHAHTDRYEARWSYFCCYCSCC